MDAGLLRDWLKEIKTWLDKNPHEGTMKTPSRMPNYVHANEVRNLQW